METRMEKYQEFDIDELIAYLTNEKDIALLKIVKNLLFF